MVPSLNALLSFLVFAAALLLVAGIFDPTLAAQRPWFFLSSALLSAFALYTVVVKYRMRRAEREARRRVQDAIPRE